MYRKDMVEDGQVFGELVDKYWYEPYHPQLIPPPMRPDGLPRRRPAPDDSVAPNVAPILAAANVGNHASLTWTAAQTTYTQIASYAVWSNLGIAGGPFVLLYTLLTPLVYTETGTANNLQPVAYTLAYTDSTSNLATTQYQYYVVATAVIGGSVQSNTVTIGV